MGDIFGIGASIQGAANASAAAMNYKAQKDYNAKYLQGVQETNETNVRLAHEQNDWNREQWNLENAYNHPAQQVERLKEAGLSSAAAAQAIEGAGNASPMQSADLSVMGAPSPLQAPQLDISGLNIIGMARAVEDLKQSKINTKMLQQENDYLDDKLFTEQELREQNLLSLKQAYQFAAKANPYKLRSFQYDLQTRRQEIELNRIRAKIMRTNYQQAKTELSFLPKFKRAELKQIFTDIAKTYGDMNLQKKQGKLLDQTFGRNEVLRAFDKYGGVPDSFAGRIAIMLAEGKIKPEDIENNVENFMNIGKYVVNGVGTRLLPEALTVLKSLIFGDDDDNGPLTLRGDLSGIAEDALKRRKERANKDKAEKVQSLMR